MNKGLGSKILELYSKGYTRKQIVEELNCCKSVVSYHLSNKHKYIKKDKGLWFLRLWVQIPPPSLKLCVT